MICLRPKHCQVTGWKLESNSHFCSITLSTKPCFRNAFSLRKFLFTLIHIFVYFAVPKMQFKERIYTGNEDDEQIVAMIHRTGDVHYRSSVRCYTRQGSAQVMTDFEERPNTDSSVITFLPGKVVELEIFIWNLRKPSC